MVVTQAQLLRAIPETYKPRLDEFVASFNQYAIPFGIDTPKRVVMYLAEVFHETGYLKSTEENMNYSAQRLMQVFPRYFKSMEQALSYAHEPERIANRVYGGRMGNGNEASGDGWKYRGRGFIGLTGRETYQRYADSEWCVGDVMSSPDMIAKFPENQKSAMWFWQTHNLNECADRCDIDKCSRIINGGTIGLANRKFLYRRFCKEFGVNTANSVIV